MATQQINDLKNFKVDDGDPTLTPCMEEGTYINYG